MRPLLVLCLLALAARSAEAAEVDPYLQRAEALMDEAEYAKAQKLIDRGLARKGLDDDTLKRLYFLEGTLWVSLGQPGRARSSYAKVLTIDPGFALGPRVPRKVRDHFLKTRDEMARSGDLESTYSVEHTPLGNLPAGADAEVRLAIGNAARAADVTRVVLHVRRLGTSDFATIDAAPLEGQSAAYVARVPPFLLASEPEPYAMEYFLDAYGGSDERLAGAGTPDLPLSFLVVPKAQLAGEGLDDEGFPLVPVAVGAGIAAAVLVTVAVVAAVFLLAPAKGRATIVVTQGTP
jgi:tetratricopeptide (TPR) repeat protein